MEVRDTAFRFMGLRGMMGYYLYASICIHNDTRLPNQFVSFNYKLTYKGEDSDEILIGDTNVTSSSRV